MADAKVIRDMSEKFRPYAVEVLQKMVRIPGLSGGEKERCDAIVKICKKADFDDVFIDDLGSVIAKIGSGPLKLAFDAHIDTVNIGDPTQWKTDPFGGEIKDGFLYGRGSSDQLGGAASMIAAGKILKELRYDGQFTLYFTFTVMEEDCDGIAWLYLIEKGGLKPDYVISTEPSLNHLHRGHRGRMEIEILLKGLACHSSRPQEGDSAAYKAAKAALAIEQLNADLNPDKENFLGKGTVVVSSIQVNGPSQCSVPDNARLYLDRRLTEGESASFALEQVKEYIQKATGEEPLMIKMPNYGKSGYKGTEFDQELYFPTWTLPEGHKLVTATKSGYKDLFNEEMIVESHVGSTNAVAFSGRHGIPSIIVGPGNPAEAHKANEKILINNLVICSALYALIPYVLEK